MNVNVVELLQTCLTIEKISETPLCYQGIIRVDFSNPCFAEIFQQQRNLFDQHEELYPDADLYSVVNVSMYKQEQIVVGNKILQGVWIKSIERYPEQNYYLAHLSIDKIIIND